MTLRKWLQISFLNLLIVAAIGVVLRYKIAYSLSFIDQKHLLHGHSHFAFSGWVTQALMALMVSRLSAYRGIDLFKRYNWLLYANLICAYGMLLSFPVQGYGLFSIIFSTCSLFVSYFFAAYVWQDIRRTGQTKVVFSWFKAATIFGALSSIGAFALAFMMATKNMHQNWYLAAVYFFLHFQYNGWFMFAILGLLFEKMEGVPAIIPALRNIYRLFALACLPAYFLSALWMPIPIWVYIIVVIAAVIQVISWIWAATIIVGRKTFFKSQLSGFSYTIVVLSLLAFSIKLLLQLGSTIPSLSTLSFGFRPIVIGYLHLVLLGVTTLFILGYSMHAGAIEVTSKNKVGIFIFIGGIILNELALMIQGISAMGYVAVPYINEALLGIAFAMFSGLLIMNLPARWFATEVHQVQLQQT
jgi:hypothetical protein